MVVIFPLAGRPAKTLCDTKEKNGRFNFLMLRQIKKKLFAVPQDLDLWISSM